MPSPKISRHRSAFLLASMPARTFQAGQLLQRELIKIGGILDQIRLDQLFHERLAHAVDVHRAALGKVLNFALRLGAARRVRTPQKNAVENRRCLAGRTFSGRLNQLLVPLALLDDHAQHRRDNISRFHDRNAIA